MSLAVIPNAVGRSAVRTSRATSWFDRLAAASVTVGRATVTLRGPSRITSGGVSAASRHAAVRDRNSDLVESILDLLCETSRPARMQSGFHREVPTKSRLEAATYADSAIGFDSRESLLIVASAYRC